MRKQQRRRHPAPTPMKGERIPGAQWDVILGPCPGCELWQVDYADDVTMLYATDVEWHEIVESVLTDHLVECVHLQRFVADLP